MKNRFVKITLTLTMLLVMAVPTQAFAAEKNCSLNQSNALNTNISKTYSQVSPASINQLMGQFSQCSNGRIDGTQLQNMLKQFNFQKSNYQQANCPTAAPAKSTTAVTPAKATPSTPAKTTTSTPAKPTTPTTPTTPTSSTLGAYEQQVVDLVNKERAAAGLSALTVNTKLAGMAEKKAEDLRDNNYFDHTSPVYGSPFEMMKQFGISYTAAGENIAKGQSTPDEVMNGWMNSPGHRANILDANYTQIGVGYVTDSNGTGYWVQEFIRP